jgi:outer membrane biosynthesis protein TonB
MPDLDGKQEKFLKTTEDAKPKPKPKPQPAPAVLPQPQAVSPHVASRRSDTPGDLAMAHPSAKPQEEKRDAEVNDQTQPEAPPVHERPRTLAEAQARNGDVGPKTRRAGGVSDLKTDVSLDVQGTPLGDYLALMVETVRSRWYQLLEDQTAETSGQVVLRFRLHPDGRVSDMKVMKNEVSDLLQMMCQRAVLDPKFKKWPREMRLDLPNDFYDITFTFYYEP